MNLAIQKKIEDNLLKHMAGVCGLEQFSKVLDYSVLPAGKLFRPKLAVASFLDQTSNKLNNNTFLQDDQNIALIASALEIHHAYTLIHDDLPCMDDDDFRRGRESTHKKYGQWQAVLAGDALLHHSHDLIGKCRHESHYTLRSFFNWGLGAKGLILGQVFDLSGLINSNYPSLLRTHELKTGRLIQVALLAGKWAAKAADNKHLSFLEIKNEMRLGANIGIVFQLLDDLSELTEPLSTHERAVNPFLCFPRAAIDSLVLGQSLIKKCEASHVNEVLAEYFAKMKSLLVTDLKLNEASILRSQLTNVDSECLTLIENFVESL